MVDLIGKKYYFFALSILIILAGVVGYIVNGFVMDIQFEGGTIIEMVMPDNKFDEKKATDIVKTTLNKVASSQKSETYNAKDAKNDINLLTLNISSKDRLSMDEQNKLIEALRKEYKLKADSEYRANNVDPFIGNEIKVNALWATFWASLLIIIYIWWRFRIMSGLSAGIMAVVALLHDILIMMAVYALFKIPLNDSFIAAVLTILGYSMNDTIIIYDRIRENSHQLRRMPIAELVNKSIIQTLNRSINTVLTVLICIITTFVFAWYFNIQSMRDFTLPLIIGIASGCYSSIFIASPLWVMWKEHKAKSTVAAPAKG